jgi:hypothetical protein
VLNEAGQISGTVVSAGSIDVAHAIAPPEKQPPMQQAFGIRVGDELVLLGADRDRSDLRPGETLALTLYWQATEHVEQAHTVSAWLSAEAGNWQLWKGPPAQGGYPFAAWQASEFVRDRYALRLPLDIPAGDFDLRLALLDRTGNPLVTGTGARWISLGQIHLHETSRLWEAPEVEHAVGAVLGDRVELLGYDLDPEQVGPGDTLHLTLVWRCRETMDVGYTVFTHLLDQDEHVWGQKDNPPVRGTYPTTLWMPGEIIVDAYDIPVAENASPGAFFIEVGMYDPAAMQRLPMSDPAGTVGDRVLLAQVEVTDRR